MIQSDRTRYQLPVKKSHNKTGSASLEKQSDELRSLVSLRTIEMKHQEKKTHRVPIFFINLDKSTDRRQSFEKDFAALPENLSSGV